MFKQITIVGLGLIGGSLGMAIRSKRLARKVLGMSRKKTTLRLAKQRGVIDEWETNARAAVCDSELVVLATPVDKIVPMARRLSKFMHPGSVLTDVGSTKAHIVGDLERGLPKGITFVGAHPLAGSEQRGINAAKRRLFNGAVCILTPTSRTSRGALRKVAALWRSVDSRVVMMSPAKHDRILADTSHLPHVIASCLVGSVKADDLPRSPTSFLEMTRIAKSDPDLWDDIFMSNRAAVLCAMKKFERSWQNMQKCLRRRDGAGMRRLLARSRFLRDALSEA